MLIMDRLFLVPQICDKEWHYYVINVEFPVVTLYLDGVTYEPYLVTDDWPIHPSQIDVQLTVGACWQGERPGGDALLLLLRCNGSYLPPTTIPSASRRITEAWNEKEAVKRRFQSFSSGV